MHVDGTTPGIPHSVVATAWSSSRPVPLELRTGCPISMRRCWQRIRGTSCVASRVFPMVCGTKNHRRHSSRIVSMICGTETITQKSKSRYLPDPTPLLEAGKVLKEYMDITRSHGLRLLNSAHDRLIASYRCFLHAREPVGITWKPKVHLAFHLVLSAGRLGNPHLLGKWIDESDNRKLSLVASTAAAPIWHKRIPSTFAHASGPSASSTTKKPKQ